MADLTGDGYPDILLGGALDRSFLLKARFDDFASCPGDCDGSGNVDVSELITGVNIVLGSAPLCRCFAGDSQRNGEITCAEVNRAINIALGGCPVGLPPPPPPPPTRTVTMQIGSTSGARGANVTIPVNVTNGAGTISAAQIDLIYSTAVFNPPTCTKDSRLTQHSLSTASPPNPPAPAGKKRLSTLVVDTSGANTFTDGRIYTCTFGIKSNAPTGTHSITGERQHVSDTVGGEFPSLVTNGSVTVF